MRCARCGRLLKKPIPVGPLFYGPVCIKKIRAEAKVLTDAAQKIEEKEVLKK